jgi:hypothetical protein
MKHIWGRVTQQLEHWWQERVKKAPWMNLIPAALFSVIAEIVLGVGRAIADAFHPDKTFHTIAQIIYYVFAVAIAFVGLLYIYFAVRGSWMRLRSQLIAQELIDAPNRTRLLQEKVLQSDMERQIAVNMKDSAREGAETTFWGRARTTFGKLPDRIFLPFIQGMLQTRGSAIGLPAPSVANEKYARRAVRGRALRRWLGSFALISMLGLCLTGLAFTPIGQRIGITQHCYILCSSAHPVTTPAMHPALRPTPTQAPKHHMQLERFLGEAPRGAACARGQVIEGAIDAAPSL